MAVNIYCIEDINNLKYIGSTKQKLKYRLSNHKYNKNCSSKKLDLDNCKIYQLEECNQSNRKEREQYWINNTKCVNKYNTIFDRKEYIKQYDEINKESKKQYQKQYHKQHYKENKEYRKERMKQYDYYQKTWGGDKRWNNNLLCIDINLFNL